MEAEVEEFIMSVENINRRPGMYLVNRVEDFEMFFLGYEIALKKKAISDFILDFKLFVNRWSDLNIESGWGKLIRFYSSTDSHSVELFTQLFRNYIEEYRRNR